MKFRLQNKKKEMFLIHEDNEGQGLYAEPGREDWEIHEPLTKSAWEDWEIVHPNTRGSITYSTCSIEENQEGVA